MNVLCPDCQGSVPLGLGERRLHCPTCGLDADLSRLETSPGAATLPLVEDLAGEILGPYYLEARIGVGGMGVVYRARRLPEGGLPEGGLPDAGAEPAVSRPVAVKVLHSDFHFQQTSFLSRFQREARALATLDHPNIVRLLDSGQDGERHYLVTEYVEGRSLAQLLMEGPLPVDRAIEVCAQVADALGYAHGMGVVHRDVKPANILVDGDRVKVVDFGLAQITGWDSTISSLTRTNLGMGTFNYLAPEQRVSAKQVDARADLFSLGVVCYEALTGELPLGVFAPPSRLRALVPRRADGLVRRALAVDPADRHANATALAAELRALVPSRRVRSRRALASVAAGLLVAAGGVAAWRVVTADAPRISSWAGRAQAGSDRQAAAQPQGEPDGQGAWANREGARGAEPSAAGRDGGAVAGSMAPRPSTSSESARPRPKVEPFDPYAFFATLGKGGIDPSPPPARLRFGDAESRALHDQWSEAWQMHQALTASALAPAPEPEPFTKGGEHPTKTKVKGARPMPDPRLRPSRPVLAREPPG